MLGIKWQETLGPIIWDFFNLYIQIELEGFKKELKGPRQTTSTCNGSPKWLQDSILKGRTLLVQMINIEQGDCCEIICEELNNLLVKFVGVFEEPQVLPPSRPHDH